MFDVGFSELVLCFLVALVVLGPEKLPAVARTLGRWTGQARVYMRNLTSELERETSGTEVMQNLREARKLVNVETQAARKTLDSLAGEKPRNLVNPEASSVWKPRSACPDVHHLGRGDSAQVLEADREHRTMITGAGPEHGVVGQGTVQHRADWLGVSHGRHAAYGLSGMRQDEVRIRPPDARR